MKQLLSILVLTLCAFAAQAQSVTVRIVANDGSLQTTNTVNLSADRVAGLLALWQKDSASKTNAGSAAITFGAFVFQELSDKGAEWTLQAGKDAIKAAGVTNSIPDGVARRWFTLSAGQQANVVSYLNGPAGQ